MREKDWLLLLLMYVAFTSRSTPAPATVPTGGVSLATGWWWGWFTRDEAPAYHAWWQANRASVAVRKTFGSPEMGATVVVFEVLEPVRWTLPRRPRPAPRGTDTDLTDVAGAIARPPSVLKKMVELVAKQTWKYLRDLYLGQRPPRAPLPAP